MKSSELFPFRHVLLVVVGCIIFAGSSYAQNEPTTDSTKKPPALKTDANDDSSGDAPKAEIPPEILKAGNEAKEKFTKIRGKLAKVMGEMRATHIRYQNDEDRSPQALELFRHQRDASRKIMDQLFEAALEVTRIMPDEECLRYLVTMIEHRMNRGYYNASMMEAGARLIDLGLIKRKTQYVYPATARAAIVSGDFGLAKRLYKALDIEKLNKADGALATNIDELEKQWNREQELIAQDKEKGENPRIKMITTQGEVTIELFINQAPWAVANFIQLVEEHYYDGLDFFQVIDNLLALTGDQSGTGEGTTGKFLTDEHERPDARQALAGSLVMAKQPIPDTNTFVPHSASAQWAITYLPMTQLGKKQTIFGRVVDGMGAIAGLYRVDPHEKKKKKTIVMPPDRILEMSVINRPEKLPEIEFYDHAAAHAGHNHAPGQPH